MREKEEEEEEEEAILWVEREKRKKINKYLSALSDEEEVADGSSPQ